MLTSADTVSESISMFPKPGRTSPSRSTLHNSPTKSSGSNNLMWTSTQGGRSPAITQVSSTMNPSPCRGHRGAHDATCNPSSTGKDSTPYHSHRPTVLTHHYSHHHGSTHHYHRDNLGHTGNELTGHNAHGSPVNPTHHHAYNTNYHSYTNYHHGGHNGPFRTANPAHQLRDFLLVQWQQFESTLGTSNNLRSIPVRNVSHNGPSNSPGTPSSPTTSTTPSCTPTPTNLSGAVGDRSTPTGSILSQSPGSPVASDHGGSLPRRLPTTALENATCVSAENVHVLSGSGYRSKAHGNTRGGFGGPLSRHGSSDVTTWPRGQATARKNSSPIVFANRGSSNLSGSRPALPQGLVSLSISSNAASPSVVATARKSGSCSPVTTTTSTSPHLPNQTTILGSNTNNNNNHNNNNIGDSVENTGTIISGPAKELHTDLQSRSDSPVVSVHFKPQAVESTARARPQTADLGARRIRGNKQLDTRGSHKPTPVLMRSAVHVFSLVDSDSSQIGSSCKNEVAHTPVPAKPTLNTESLGQSFKTTQAHDCPTPSGVAPNVPPNPSAILRGSVSKPTQPTAVSVGYSGTVLDDCILVRNVIGVTSGDEKQLSCVGKTVAVAMSVNVTSGPPSPPRSSNRADTPTANGEHYWTPDPPASPCTGSALASCPPAPVSNFIPSTTVTLQADFSEQSMSKTDSVPLISATNTRDSSSGPRIVDEVHSSRTRLESLNDVD
ncbi:hypothetical protein FGIG_02620 [Fasciola gigantica]|uniref:Uncharacterized protein n=1 Tax=Fasciola gigantica TaxID=46835 RepID=A0A504YPE6_FASGI|nr:hypothetical protein FGIG_02620 [Fasciola gigantica]